VADLAGFFVFFHFAEPVFAWLMRPMLAAMPGGIQLQFLSPPEAFFVYMKLAFGMSLIALSPFVFYHIWAFVAPGLYEEERKYVIPLAAVSGLFFIGGAAFCYYLVFPIIFHFFMTFTSEHIKAAFTMAASFGFCIKLLLAFGLVFEMPLFAFALSRLGIITPHMMRRARKYAILVMFIVATILTPPDVASQILMAIPMIILYEFSIYICAVFGKKTTAPAGKAAEDKEEHGETGSPPD
jgi:sec-independent protein translocase protein TatC